MGKDTYAKEYKKFMSQVHVYRHLWRKRQDKLEMTWEAVVGLE
jgi:hypothetical protein